MVKPDGECSDNETPQSPDVIREILVRYRNGDEDAQAELFRLLSDKDEFGLVLLYIARKMLPPNHPARRYVESDDVVDSAIGSGIRRLDEFRGETTSQFLAWLRRIVQSKISSAYRRQKRERALADEPLDKSPSDLLVSVIGKETRRELRRAIERLPATYRIVVELRLLGLTSKEIQDFLGLTPEAIRKRESRATAILRGLLANVI